MKTGKLILVHLQVFLAGIALVGCPLAAGDYSCGNERADGAVFWRGAQLLNLFYGKGETNLLAGKQECREMSLSDGRKAVNHICRENPVWRVEKAISPNGDEVELTFGTGQPAFVQGDIGRDFELRIPWKQVEGKPFQALRGVRNPLQTVKGVFHADFKPVSQVRFLALILDGKSGPALDLNPRGMTAADSDQYRNAMLRGQWQMLKKGDFLVLSSRTELGLYGGYFGAKFRIFTGGIQDYARRHARNSFRYLSPLSSLHRLSFGSPKHGNMYTSADAQLYTEQHGFGWLDGFQPVLKTEAPEGAYYSHAEGNEKAVFQFGKLQPGLYMLTIGCGNLKSGGKKFSVRINGEEKIRDFSLSDGQACDLTIPFYAESNRIRIEFSGIWLVSTMNLQMLLNQYEDYVIRRGIWVVDDFEPMLGMSPNSAVRQSAKFQVGKEVYPLPVPGQEAAGALKPFIRESAAVEPADWQFNLKIASHGTNLSAMSALLPPDAAEKTVRSHAENRTNFLIHNGIFSRHLYPTETAASEQQVLKRLADEAHKHNMHVLDHQDYSLVWDCGSGFRTLIEETPNLQRSIYDHGIHVTICPSVEARRRQFFERTVHLIWETGIDGLMLDEFDYFASAGCCGCAACRKEFFRETGWYLPVNELSPDLNNPQSRLWQVFREFQDKKIGDFWVDLRKKVRKIRPDFVFITYSTHRYFVEGWAGQEHMRAGFLYGTEILNRNVFNSARSTLAYRKLKNVVAARYGMPIMGLVYSGSVPGIGYFGWAINNMNGQATWFLGAENKQDFNRFPENMNRKTARPVADIAVLFARKSSTGERNPNISADTWLPGKVMGLAQTLDAMHQAYVFIDESSLTPEKLAPYKVLMMPAAPVLTARELQIVRAFAENGGKLMITSLTGTLDEFRKSRTWPFADWFGLRPAKLGVGNDLTYKGKKLHLVKRFYMYLTEGKPKPGTRNLVSYAYAPAPLVATKKVGKGLVYWFNAELTRGLYMEEWFQPGMKFRFILDPVQNALVQELLTSFIGDAATFKLTAPENVFTSFYRDGDTLMVHFLNHTGFRCEPGQILSWNVAEDAFPPLSKPIQGAVKVKRKISEVYAVSPDFKGRKQLTFTQNGDTVKFTFPPELLKVYTIVKLR